VTNRGLWLGVLLGTPLLLLGLREVLVHADRTHPAELARWVIGAALVLDLAILPLSLLVGRATRGRPAIRWAASSIAVTLLVSWPYVRGYGRSPSNPSLLPRDYGSGVLVAVVATLGAAAAWALVAKSLRVSEAAAAPAAEGRDAQ
jgi:hypothetical protein